MAEKKEIQFDNIKNIGTLAGEELEGLLKQIKKSEKELNDFIRGISDKNKKLNEIKAEEAKAEATEETAAETQPAEDRKSVGRERVC